MKKIFLVGSILVGLTACSEESRLMIKVDSIAPACVSNVRVKNIPGGAILKYDLPEDEDLMIVKTLYRLKADGELNEASVSAYVDSVIVKGFGTEETQKVEIVTIDRSRNESTPVTVEIQPLEAPVKTIAKSLQLIADFGGVLATWENVGRDDISVVLEEKDKFGDYIPCDVYYSSAKVGRATTRGLDTIPREFKIYIKDRWGNQSDAKEHNITPLFEEKFNMAKFSSIMLEGDEADAWGWVMANVWDGSNTGSGFHTAQGTGRWPHVISMDMGQVGKISRVKLWQRWQDNYLFAHGNMKRFEIWGTADETNLNDWSTWTKLIDCESTKPSGLPIGQYSAEDLAYVKAGEDFSCPPEMPAVRYLRIKVTENWSGSDFFHFMEMEVYGQLEKKKVLTKTEKHYEN